MEISAVPRRGGMTGPPCACGRPNPSYSHRLGRLTCARCYFASIPAAEREASDQGWARRDLATQVRRVARRLDGRDRRQARLLDLALDIELGDEIKVAAALREMRALGGAR